MHDTHDLDLLAGALIDLVGALNSPRQDEVLLREAGVTLDRALFPLLVRIARAGSVGIVELAGQAGRDHSTISRQVARLERLGLVARQAAAGDQRVREARITEAGEQLIAAIAGARRRLLGRLLANWSAQERRSVAQLNRRLADAMKAALPPPG
ncbi:Transcriptional regulator, MarR family [Roseomonas mucosa]|uniref:Transcriptional regulator, MarR family n=1 Tax=Roseomonas mucosa TaxID=207340 RepID=A0A4Y1MS95_9PROT|nr:MarR family transcriptional regulator [Roseomonas mucosa]AWV20861.1 Transcriptional regulator, MarR family [Roseomonas mucosa]MDT8277223.1 MarR family transcriptional regulator [Roseomonas mucosa]MDT8355423.1 MarR family transcriptional regulator [Roseomonas mucosa]